MSTVSPHREAPGREAPPKVSKITVAVVLTIVLIVAAILAVTGIVSRKRTEHKLAVDTTATAVPEVLAIVPKQGAPAQEIVLPGNIQAFRDAPIYARTSGYLKHWYVDIGGHVKRGQLLAVIESPEVDQQLQQGKADLATAQSNLQIAQATSDRYNNLLTSNSVSRQEAENFAADARGRQTIVNSAEANVRRLQDLQSFERITAPFDGVVTARNTDEGQLITAGSNSGSTPGAARELFHVAAINPLRVFVNVPQIDSRDAKPSTTASLTLAQFPGRTFPGKLVRNADAIDPATRTLLVEVDVPNRTGELLPGSFAQVHMKLATGSPTVLLPVSALIFRGEGMRAATLEHDQAGDKAHLVPITLGRDFGTQVEVVSGLAPGQRVIDSPPDSLSEGEQVHVLQPKVQAQSSPK